MRCVVNFFVTVCLFMSIVQLASAQKTILKIYQKIVLLRKLELSLAGILFHLNTCGTEKGNGSIMQKFVRGMER